MFHRDRRLHIADQLQYWAKCDLYGERHRLERGSGRLDQRLEFLGPGRAYRPGLTSADVHVP
jgi:hypothetical protein